MDLKIDLSSFTHSETELSESTVYDVLIIGGGPAALNAALYAARKKLNVGLITEDIGGQITQSSSIENWLGDLDTKSNTLVNRFYHHVEHFNIHIVKNTRVLSSELESSIKKIICNNKKIYQAKAIIIATGKSPRPLNVPGEQEFIGRGLAYCTTCDGPVFEDKHVVVVGGGNSGVEGAIDLLSYAKHVTIIQNLSELTADAILTDKVLTHSRINTIYDAIVVRVEGKDTLERIVLKNTKTNEEFSLETDGVFVEIGLLPASNFVSDLIKDTNGEIRIEADCSTQIAGVFAAGDVTTVPYKQVVIAAGEGAKAALSAFNYLITQH